LCGKLHELLIRLFLSE